MTHVIGKWTSSFTVCGGVNCCIPLESQSKYRRYILSKPGDPYPWTSQVDVNLSFFTPTSRNKIIVFGHNIRS